jgi:hypothetical protein
LTERHARALRAERSSIRSAGLIMLVLALGAGCGYFTKLSPRGFEVARFMNGLLQNLTQEKIRLLNLKVCWNIRTQLTNSINRNPQNPW